MCSSVLDMSRTLTKDVFTLGPISRVCTQDWFWARMGVGGGDLNSPVLVHIKPAPITLLNIERRSHSGFVGVRSIQITGFQEDQLSGPLPGSKNSVHTSPITRKCKINLSSYAEFTLGWVGNVHKRFFLSTSLLCMAALKGITIFS